MSQLASTIQNHWKEYKPKAYSQALKQYGKNLKAFFEDLAQEARVYNVDVRDQQMKNGHDHLQAKMIADNCKATIAFDDAKDATEALRTLKAEPSIVFGSIYTINGKVFASFYRDEIDTKVGLSEPQPATAACGPTICWCR